MGETGRKQVQKNAPAIKMVYSTDFQTNVNYLWRLTQLNFGFYYKYNGQYPEVFLSQDGKISQTIMEGYHTADINMSKMFWNNRIQLQIGAKNLFNNTNIAVKGESGGGGIHSGGTGPSPVGWGRTYFVRCALNFNKTLKQNEK